MNTLEKLKVPKLSLDLFESQSKRLFCYDSNYTLYFSCSDNRIFRLNIYQDVSQKVKQLINDNLKAIDPNNQDSNEQNEDKFDRVTKKQFERHLSRSQFSARLIVEENFFRDRNEQIVRLKVFTSSSKVEYLLIFSTRSMYYMELPSEPESLQMLNSDKIRMSPVKISYHEYDTTDSRPRLYRMTSINLSESNQSLQNLLKSYSFCDLKIVKTNVFVRFSKNSGDSGKARNPESRKTPVYYIIRFILDDQSLESKRVDRLTEKTQGLRISDCDPKLFLALYDEDIREFWINPGQLNRVYFCLENVLYMANLKYLTKQNLASANYNECKIIYSNKFGINFLQFFSEEKLAVCSDKPNRIILIETENWTKIRDIRINFGQIQQMTLSFRQDLLYV